MLWVLIKLQQGTFNEYLQNMFLKRSKKKYEYLLVQKKGPHLNIWSYEPVYPNRVIVVILHKKNCINKKKKKKKIISTYLNVIIMENVLGLGSLLTEFN